MGRWGKSALAILLALGTMGSTCDESDNRVTGTYTLTITESRDTCDQEPNTFASEVSITAQQGGGYVVSFGDDAELTGDFSDDGVLVAQGTIEDQGGGRTTTMIVGFLFRQGSIEGTGRLTYNGTFPDVEGLCIQEFGVVGQRSSGALAPIVG